MHIISVALYSLAIYFYRIGIFIASFFNRKAKLWIAGRKYWSCRLSEMDLRQGKRVWFHCASLGEYEQAAPVIERLATDFILEATKAGYENAEARKNKIIITFFSPSGFEIQKQNIFAETVLYLPLDTKGNAANFIRLIKPDVAVFVKYEFWYHYLNELKKKNVPVILFSSVFRPNQVFFKWYGGFFRLMLGLFSKIYVQNPASQQLLENIAIESEVAFDTRFDRVHDISRPAKPITGELVLPEPFPFMEKFKAGSKILIAGSTWPKDEELLIQLINEKVATGYKYIIAPHNIDKNRIAAMAKAINGNTQLLSEINRENATGVDVLIIDSIGKLKLLYAFADVAYIGGGFDASIHNVLEAIVYGIPVVFGPNHQKSEEAKELITLQLGFTISDYEGLKQKIRYLVAQFVTDDMNKQKLKNYIQSHLGGAETVVQTIHRFLHK